MAQRVNKKYRRVDSAQVQGEGSYVVFASPTFDDIATFSDLIFTEPGKALSDMEAIKLVVPMLHRFVFDWDWVNDEGEPLPKPKGNAEVFKELTYEEQAFLVTALTAAMNLGAGEAKN